MTAATETTSAPARILIIDDKQYFQNHMRLLFRGARYETTAALSGLQALELLRDRDFDLIILDLCLESEPEGLQVLQQLKDDQRTREIPVVVVTGQASEEELVEALKHGASECCLKDFQVDLFKAKVERLLEAARGRKHRDVGRVILHVEDEDEWAHLVGLWLQRKGYRVHRVKNQIEMRSFLQDRPQLPQCILMDLSLGDSDGLELCAEIKNSPLLQRIPIVVLTSRSNEKLKCLDRQALYVVSKTRDPERELVAVLQSVLAQHERSAGVVDAGDLRLDPRERRVYHDEKLLATLAPGIFAVFHRLLLRSPEPVPEDELRAICSERPAYGKEPHHDAGCRTLDTYIYNLRRCLGEDVGARIRCVRGVGYAYIRQGS